MHSRPTPTQTNVDVVLPTATSPVDTFNASPSPAATDSPVVSPTEDSTPPADTPAPAPETTTPAQAANPPAPTTPVLATTPSTSADNSEIDTYLKAHNDFRGQHGAAALTWDATLASKAQEWANKCVFQHSGGSLGPYGGKSFILSRDRSLSDNCKRKLGSWNWWLWHP